MTRSQSWSGMSMVKAFGYGAGYAGARDASGMSMEAMVGYPVIEASFLPVVDFPYACDDGLALAHSRDRSSCWLAAT